MGIVSYISSFFKSKKTIVEQLEEIDELILSLDDQRKSSTNLEKRLIGSLVFYSIVAYVISAIIFFLYYYQYSSWSQCGLLAIPLFIFPFIVIGIKRALHSYFVERISRTDDEVVDLRKRKKKLLDTVMDKEPYKKAKDILERFDPMRFNRIDLDQRPSPGLRLSEDTQLFRRTVGPSVPPPVCAPGQPGMRPPMLRPLAGRPPHQGGQLPQPQNWQRAPGQWTPRLHRPILSRDRSPMDRIIDALVGDGPEKRYALICCRCSGHNGMAMAEEFQFLAFQCCFCGVFNPPRRQRPNAPIVGYIEAKQQPASGGATPPDTGSEAGDDSSALSANDNVECDENQSETGESLANDEGRNNSHLDMDGEGVVESSSNAEVFENISHNEYNSPKSAQLPETLTTSPGTEGVTDSHLHSEKDESMPNPTLVSEDIS